jgi:hypothetical protein
LSLQECEDAGTEATQLKVVQQPYQQPAGQEQFHKVIVFISAGV